MYDIRLRQYSDSGLVKGRVLPTLELSATDAESATGRLTFSTTAKVAGRLSAPFVVGLEETTGAVWTSPRNNLFIVTDDAEDAADQSDAMSFTAQSYVGWLLSQAIHWWEQWNSIDGKTRTFNAPPGYILDKWFWEAQTSTQGGAVIRGWAPTLTWDFTPTKDSFGVAWKPEDTIEQHIPLWQPYSSFIQSWVEQGKFEWWAEGMKMRLARVGTGTDRTDEVVLGGPGFSSAPAKTDFSNVFTTVVIIPEEDAPTFRFNPGADSRFGGLEKSMSMSGVTDRDVAAEQAAPAMQEGRAKKLELSYDWTPSAGGPIPGSDFDIGDTVTARRKTGKQPLRVIGIQRAKRAGEPATVRAIVGDKLVGVQAKLAKRVGAVSTGTIIGGSGAALPSSPGTAPLTPAVPGGVRVQSNTATWAADGSAATAVTVAWDQVTTDTRANRLDTDLYEVAARLGSVVDFQSVTTTASLSAVISGWEPGTPRYVRVRARSVAGRWSAWSGEIAVTPIMPTSIVPKPVTGLVCTSNTAVFAGDGSTRAMLVFSWSPVTQSTDDTPVETAEYEALVGSDTVRLSTPTLSVTTASGAVVKVQVRAKSVLGVWGDFSPIVQVTAAGPAVAARAPSTPVLVTGAGVVAARWDGQYVPPGGTGAFETRIEARVAPGDWIQQGAGLSVAGSQTITIGDVGQTVQVRARAYDNLGRLTGTSGTASIVVTGIAMVDLDAAIRDALNETVTATFEQYSQAPDRQTPPAGGWSASQPANPDEGVWWRRTATVTTGGTTVYGPPVLLTGAPGGDAVLLRIDSSRGTAFKNNAISTVLSVSVFKGSLQIQNISDLWAEFGSGAYLEWWWRRINATSFGVISSSDSRLSQAGFALTVSPDDVDEQTVFQCVLHT